MALESPLILSTGVVMSAFSPYTDSPASPALPKSPRFSVMVQEPPYDSLRPPSVRESPKAPSSSFEPIDPSPITSDKTDIEDSAVEDEMASNPHEPPSFREREQAQPEPTVNQAGHMTVNIPAGADTWDLQTIDTSVPARPRSTSDGTPQSVIHAPEGFKEFGLEKDETDSPPPGRRKTPSPTPRSDLTINPSKTLNLDHAGGVQKAANSPISPPPISTAIAPRYSLEDATPRAQTRQEVEALQQERGRRSRTSFLEDIPEAQDQDPDLAADEEVYTEDEGDSIFKGASSTVVTAVPSSSSDQEMKALKTALTECWTLCNTLAGLSSIHRERIFNFTGSGDIQEQAWKSCWKLCQKLYESRDEDHDRNLTPTLDLCRDFCQALFDARLRENDLTDSVLRVSFELNNHLYNTHDQNLPEAFRERTLDFYITLCHRLMKQRTRLAAETDSLLRACWSLAEMLFSLRQNRREGKPADEELLGSAVQACWDLCDLFREGWTQVRPDRGTPRPSQTTFSISSNTMKQSSLGTVEERHIEPVTPSTIFEDMALSPDGDDRDDAPPNILVLGIENQQVSIPRWSSNASTLSDYSQSSVKTSSTVKTRTTGAGSSTAVANEASQLTRLKILIVKAAINCGYQRSSGQTLFSFGKTLTPTSFGKMPWQMDLLDKYQRMLLTDSAFRTPLELPSRRVSAPEMARAVEWIVRSGQYTFLGDLFRLVFGFHPEEAEMRSNVLIQS